MFHRLCTLLTTVAAGATPLFAQGERTVATVTPDGVFYQRTTGAAALPGAATDSPAGVRWTYADPNWITEHVSVGHHGTMAWLAQNLNNERYSLLATTEINPPTFITELPRVGSQFLLVKAADKAPFAVTATLASGGGGQVEFWSIYSATPMWTLSVANNVLIDVSETGQFVAVGFSPTSNSAQVDVYDAFAGPTTPIATLTATTHSLRQFDLSDDGTTLLMATQTDNHVFDVFAQQEIFTDGSTVSHDAHAISRDGSAWGRGGFNPVRAWVKSGGVYNQVLNFTETTLGFAVFTAAAISNDGTTFAAAAYDANANANLRVYCWDLTPTGSTLLWSYSSNGTGSLQTTPQAVSISDDGGVIAVGTWGDSNNTHPEVLLFDRNGTGTPIGSIDTPGSCFDLDLSGDGQFLVVGTKAVHANTSGRGGEGYSYDLGGQSLFVQGTASIGRTPTLNVEGSAGELVILGFANSVAAAPLTIPGIGGELLLDLTSFLGSFVAGTIPSGGTLAYPFAIPANPAFVGAELAAQALHGPAFTFTNVVRLPITP